MSGSIVPIELRVCLEKTPGKGEDADPLLLSGQGSWTVGVFDGLGGAGSQTYLGPLGEAISGAALAARTARIASQSFFSSPEMTGCLTDDVDVTGALYGEYLAKELQDAAGCETAPSRIRGRLLRRLPTTIATLHASICVDEQHAVCSAYWAGDSRAYLLTPDFGLQQLTTDSLVVPGDAWENLFNDSPMSNFANADSDIDLSRHRVTSALPMAIVAATDGCFTYLPSPPLFEHFLLETLTTSTDVVDWKRAIKKRLQTTAADDASLALIGIGWADFAEMKNHFRQRLGILEEQKASFAPQDESLDQMTSEQYFSWWKTYQSQYEALLGTSETESRR